MDGWFGPLAAFRPPEQCKQHRASTIVPDGGAGRIVTGQVCAASPQQGAKRGAKPCATPIGDQPSAPGLITMIAPPKPQSPPSSGASQYAHQVIVKEGDKQCQCLKQRGDLGQRHQVKRRIETSQAGQASDGSRRQNAILRDSKCGTPMLEDRSKDQRQTQRTAKQQNGDDCKIGSGYFTRTEIPTVSRTSAIPIETPSGMLRWRSGWTAAPTIRKNRSDERAAR